MKLDFFKVLKNLTDIDLTVKESMVKRDGRTLDNLNFIREEFCMPSIYNPQQYGLRVFFQHKGADNIIEIFSTVECTIPEVSRRFNDYHGAESDYSMSIKEYRKYYGEESFNFFLENDLSKAISIIKADEANYNYLMGRFELSIMTIRNTLMESQDLDGIPTIEAMDVAKKILSAFTQMILEKDEEIRKLKEEMDEASRKSHVQFLNQELEYVEKFVTMKKLDEKKKN